MERELRSQQLVTVVQRGSALIAAYLELQGGYEVGAIKGRVRDPASTSNAPAIRKQQLTAFAFATATISFGLAVIPDVAVSLGGMSVQVRRVMKLLYIEGNLLR